MTEKKKKQASYRELSEELQIIIESMQSNDADIDGALKQYERGIRIVHELEEYLKLVGNTVKDMTSK